MSHFKGFFKKITGETNSYDELAKKPIVDAEYKLNLFRDATTTSLAALEAYAKLMTKQIDSTLAEKFAECHEIFSKFEAKGESLNPALQHVMGIVFGRLFEAQRAMSEEVNDFVRNLERNVINPLIQYQKDVTGVKETRKELKDAYDKIEQCRQNLDKAKKDVENAQRIASSYSGSQQGRISLMVSSDPNKRTNDINRLEEKVQRMEKDLDEATAVANEKYDKYTEGLYRKVADECELSSKYLDYLKLQKKYHKQACKRLEKLIPEVKSSLECYTKKPVFGCPLAEYVYSNNPNLRLSNESEKAHLSPVIRKLIESMRTQNAFDEEGLFRIAGSRVKMNCLIHAINAGYIDYLDTDNEFDVHCLASVLKQYLRELPDSILCNDLYDDWISAIGKSPVSKKIEAFKEVLKKLPKTNYDNLKYLILFLAQVVENSDKTKMTSQNMSICFGVSLLSNNAALNGSNNAIVLSPPSSTVSNSITNAGSSINEGSMPSGKSIDMATATNVFDFILNNYKELFSAASAAVSSNTSSVYSNGGQPAPATAVEPRPQQRLNNSTVSLNLINSRQPAFEQTNPGFHLRDHHSDSPHSNRYSVMIIDNSSSEPVNTFSKAAFHNNSQPQPQHSPTSLSSSTSTSTLTTSNSNITNMNRHIKKSSLDSRFVDSITDLTASNTSLSSKTSQSQSNQNDSNSGSTSPRSRPKKQAPAPPPVTRSSGNDGYHSGTSSSYSSPVSDSNQGAHGEASGAGRQSSTSSTNHHSAIITISNPNAPANSSFNHSKLSNEFSQLSVSSLLANPEKTTPAGASSHVTPVLEKPNQPPPTIPNRPPPIGFNVSLFSDTPVAAGNGNESSGLPYPSTSPSSSIYIVQPNNTSITESSDSVHSPTSISSGSNGVISSSYTNKLTNGFGVDSGHSSQVSSSTLPNAAVLLNNNASSSSFLSTSMSSTSSSSQEILNSPNNTLVKPPKPAVPPKRGNMIAAHISKFESKANGDEYADNSLNNSDDQQHLSPKTPSEITSL